MDKLIRSPKGTAEEDEMIREIGREVDLFVRNRWEPAFWETAWFVNPPVRPQPFLICQLASGRWLTIVCHTRRDSKASRIYPTFMSLHERNLLTRSHVEDSKLSLGVMLEELLHFGGGRLCLA